MAVLNLKNLKLLDNLVQKPNLDINSFFTDPVWISFVKSINDEEWFCDFPADSLENFIFIGANIEKFCQDWSGSVDQRAELKAAIVSAFDSYPREYVLTVWLESMRSYAGFEIELSPDIKIFTASNFKLLDEGPLFSGVFLSVKVRGYLQPFKFNMLAEETDLLLRQLLFFFNRDPRFGGFSLPRHDAKFRWRDTGGRPLIAVGGPKDDLLFTLRSMAIDDDQVRRPGLLGSFGAVDDSERSSIMQNGWSIAKTFFTLPKGSFKNQVGAAIEWYMDSFYENNQTVAYLKACIGIESILGDDQKPMSELSFRLADRYAFMIGKNREERNALVKKFTDVLHLRGELVHARERRLSKTKAPLLADAREILLRCIEHELTTM
jgi:hypothetical protein